MPPEPGEEAWAELGIAPGEVGRWKEIGFSPFEAALAHGDGFTPLIARHYEGHFRRIAGSWEHGTELSTLDALHWHRAGFSPKEAVRFHAAGVELAAARASTVP